MNNSQALGSNNGSTNGSHPRELKPPSSGQTRSGRFCEMAAVVLFMASVLSLVLLQDGKWLVLILLAGLVGAIVSYKVAVREALGRVNREKQEQAKFKYQVTKIRLLTLRSVGVPPDIRRALTRLLCQSPASADDFLRKVAHDLSWERIDQWREEILANTRIDDNSAAVTVVNLPDQSPAVSVK